MNITVYFIPPYSPDFALVEMCFSQIKRKLVSNVKEKHKANFKRKLFKGL